MSGDPWWVYPFWQVDFRHPFGPFPPTLTTTDAPTWYSETKPMGWECPRCHVIHGPAVSRCESKRCRKAEKK